MLLKGQGVIVWKLDAVMQARGVKGRELARRMDIGENYLSRVRHEAPDRLSLKLLDALCRELDCDLSDLLEYQAPGRTRRKPAASLGRSDEKKQPRRGSRPKNSAEVAPPKTSAVVSEGERRAAAAPPSVPEAPLPDKPVPAPPRGSAAVPLRFERRVPQAAEAVSQEETRSAFVEEVLAPLMAELTSETAVQTPPAEVPPAPGASGMLKNSALQARLDRLKKRRPLSV